MGDTLDSCRRLMLLSCFCSCWSIMTMVVAVAVGGAVVSEAVGSASSVDMTTTTEVLLPPVVADLGAFIAGIDTVFPFAFALLLFGPAILLISFEEDVAVLVFLNSDAGIMPLLAACTLHDKTNLFLKCQ